MTKARGFTLIEVMIAMVIMSMLSILVSSAIRSAVRNKKSLEARLVSETMLYDSLKILKQDLEKAFHYQDVFFEIESQALSRMEEEQNRAKHIKTRTKKVSPPQLTHFLGEPDHVHFTSLNHFRVRYNALESDQMEVGYYLEECKNRRGQGSSQCLWRRSSSFIDDRVEEGGASVVLVDNVSDFKLSYRDDGENDDWLDRWRSDNKGREDHRNRFPSLVKIELKIGNKDNPKVKTVEQSIVARIYFPNNKKLLDTKGLSQGRGP